MVVVVPILGTGCSSKNGAEEKSAPATAEKISCDTNADCRGEWKCLGGYCTDPRAKALYTDPKNAVTPDKMKQEVEKMNKEREKKVDKTLDL